MVHLWGFQSFLLYTKRGLLRRQSEDYSDAIRRRISLGNNPEGIRVHDVVEIPLGPVGEGRVGFELHKTKVNKPSRNALSFVA